MVSNSPMLPKSSETGISATWTGTTSSPTTTRKSQSRPGNSSQAKAYPAKEPRTSTSRVAGTAIANVFRREPVMVSLASSRS